MSLLIMLTDKWKYILHHARLITIVVCIYIYIHKRKKEKGVNSKNSTQHYDFLHTNHIIITCERIT